MIEKLPELSAQESVHDVAVVDKINEIIEAYNELEHWFPYKKFTLIKPKEDSHD